MCPKTALLLPVWPRGSRRLDTPGRQQVSEKVVDFWFRNKISHGPEVFIFISIVYFPPLSYRLKSLRVIPSCSLNVTILPIDYILSPRNGVLLLSAPVVGTGSQDHGVCSIQVHSEIISISLCVSKIPCEPHCKQVNKLGHVGMSALERLWGEDRWITKGLSSSFHSQRPELPASASQVISFA